jgi:hypothetical protein
MQRRVAIIGQTPIEWIFAAFVVLTVIHLFVPSARSGIVSIYDAGMFAIYLIVLAWGVTRIVDGERSRGWGLLTCSTIPLISLVRDAQNMFCRILAECDVPTKSDLHFEFTVRPPLGRGKSSHTDVMAFSECDCIAIEAKWTEPPYETVATWLSKKPEHKENGNDECNRKEANRKKANRKKVLSGWIELLNGQGPSLTADDVTDLEYQMLHRAASACFASRATGKRPRLAYFKFSPSEDFASKGFVPATLGYYKNGLESLWTRLGSPSEFPFFLVEIRITPTEKFFSINHLSKGETTGQTVRNALQEFRFFEFPSYHVTHIGQSR